MPEADEPIEAPEATTEAEQSEAQDDTGTPPPWGDDFDPSRAWKTITHLRDREKELETSAKALERLKAGEDRDTFAELAAKFGFEIPDDDEDDLDDEGPGEDPTLSRVEQLERRIQEREAKEALEAFHADLDKIAADEEIELSKRQREIILRDSIEAGFTPDTTRKAFKELIEEFKGWEEKRRPKPEPPHVPGATKSATDAPNLDNPRERQAWLKARVEQQG